MCYSCTYCIMRQGQIVNFNLFRKANRLIYYYGLSRSLAIIVTDLIKLQVRFRVTQNPFLLVHSAAPEAIYIYIVNILYRSNFNQLPLNMVDIKRKIDKKQHNKPNIPKTIECLSFLFKNIVQYNSSINNNNKVILFPNVLCQINSKLFMLRQTFIR